MPNSLSKVPQNWFTNFQSQWPIICFGKPCKWKNSQINSFATSMVDIMDLVGIKWACFMNWSKTTKYDHALSGSKQTH